MVDKLILFSASSIQVRKQTSTPDFVRDYTKRLKKLYISGTRFTQPDWPPIKAREPTNLVIVSESGVEEGFSKEKIETLKDDYVHGKIDSITAYKKEIELADILSPVPSNDGKSTNEPKVLMDGAPGVGKTTLAIKACSDWAENRIFGRYELLILVSLREIKHKKGESLGDLFPCCTDKRVVDYYERNGGKHVVMIFDGYDELSYQQRRVNSIFLDVIRGDVLPDCAVLVTSRPYASKYLHELESINRHVEVLGFKKEQIYACVEKSLPDSSNAKALIQQLEEREDILSLCYIPLNCMIMIHVYEQKKTLSTTMTELMHQFIIDTVMRGIKYVELSPEVENVFIKDLDNLPHPADEQLSALEKLAYQNLIKDQFIFSQDELLTVFSSLKSFSESYDVTKLCLSLLTSIHTVSGNAGRHFQFLHLTIQEYLAARYAVKTSSSREQIGILQKFVNESRFRLFLLFYVGMMPIDRDTAQLFFDAELQSNSDSKKSHFVFQDLLKADLDPVTHEEKFLYFAHMIFESQHFETFVHLFEMLNDKKVLSLKKCKLTLFDCTVLSHFLCSIDHSWDELDLQDCSLGVHSLHVFDRVYQDRKSCRKTKFKSINLNGNDPEILNNLKLFPWLSDVKILTLENETCKVTKPLNLRTITHIPQISVKVGFSSSNDAYTYPAKLCICKTDTTEVKLCRAKMGEGFEKYLHGIKVLELTNIDCGILHTLNPFIQSLEVLVICEIDDIDGWLLNSASILAQSTILRELKICDVGLTISSVRIFFHALSRNTSLKELHISTDSDFLHQVEDLGEEIELFLSTNGTVTSLHVCNFINDHLAQYLIAGLKDNSVLDMLDVSNNPLGIDTIEELLCVVLNHISLNQVSIENNVFHKKNMEWRLQSIEEVTEKLFCALSHHNSLCDSYHDVVKLSLSTNDLDSFVCIRLFQALQQNRCLKSITFNKEFSHIVNDKSVSNALKRMLVTNNTIQSLHYHSSKDQHDCVYEDIASGISESLPLREVSLTLCSFSDISRIMKGLRNCRLKVLVLRLEFHYRSKLQLTQSDSELIGIEFEQFLSSNSTVVELNLEFTLSDSVVSGIAEGLLRNKSLKTLRIRFGPHVSQGAAKLFRSASNTLTTIAIETIGLLTKEEDHWSLELYENSIAMWSQLKYVLQAGKPKYKLKLSELARSFPYSYQVYKVFSVLALSENLKIHVIDFSKLRTLNNDKLGGKKIGMALRNILTNLLSLEILILNSSTLPHGVWEYAAHGLSCSKSLKVLDLCCSGISANDAASIFTSLKSNGTLEKLDISQNPDIKQSDHHKLNDAIEAMFQYNTSICEVNMKQSIDDKAIVKAMSGLQRSEVASLKKLSLDEQCFSISTVQHVLLMVKNRFGLVLEFSEVSFVIPAEQTIWSNFIDITLWRNPFDGPNLRKSKSDKLFCCLCNLCLQNNIILLNVIEVELDDINDEAVIIIFKLLSQDTLSRLKKLSLAGKYRYTISGNTASDSLKNMLVTNETLDELILHRIDEAVAIGLASGLSENKTLKMIRVYFVAEILNEHSVANLLSALDSSNAGLLKLEIGGLPPIHRPTKWSKWFIAPREAIPYHYLPKLLTQFIHILCKICDSEVDVFPDSGTAKSILTSISELTFSTSDLKINSLINFFKLLANNCNFKILNLSGSRNLAREGISNLCKAIEDMFYSNTAIKELNLSGTLDDEVTCGIMAGLKGNQALKVFQTDINTLNIRFIAGIMEIFSREESCLTSLTVNNLFVLQKLKNSHSFEWTIKVLDEVVWYPFLNLLKKFTPGMKLLAAFDSLTHGGCIWNSPRFDITCEKLHFQLTKDERMQLAHRQNTDRINVKSLLTNVTTLKFLTLKGYNISDDVCSNIAYSIRCLNKLDLSHNSISGHGAVILIQGLIMPQVATVLEELDISYNNLSESSCNLGHLMKCFFESNTQVKTFKYAGCYINDNVCECIASGIQTNHSLLCLDLSCNDITIIGITKMICCLQQNDGLQELDFSGNPLIATDDDDISQMSLGRAICTMLKCNETLMNFNLDCDTFNTIILKEISKGLENNSALKLLTINAGQCVVSIIITLIPTLTTNLTCLNFSDVCSLFSSNVGWTLEVKRNNMLSQVFVALCLSKMVINEVIVSKASVAELNLSECSFNCSQFLSLFKSLEDNDMLKKLVLCVPTNLFHIEYEALGHGIKWLLKKNSTLEHLKLKGFISDEVFQGIEVGIKVNSSIKALHVHISYLQLDTIVRFAQSVEMTNILRVNLYPLLKLFRSSTNSLWLVKSNHLSPLFLDFICNINQGNVKQSILRIFHLLNFSYYPMSIDDTLTCSLIHALGESEYFEIPTSWIIGEEACHALEIMISHNKCLQHLAFGAVNDSMVAAIAKGLRDNKTLQTLEINIAPLTKSGLNQLLQSLINNPLKLSSDGHRIRFIRCISGQQISEMGQTAFSLSPVQSPNFEKVLQCLSLTQGLRELTIASPQQTSSWYQDEVAMGNGLKDMLNNCRSLEVLNLQYAVSEDTIQGLIAGLKQNHTLHTLKLNAHVNDTLPLLVLLNYTNIAKLEVLQYSLLKVPHSSCWKIECKCFDEALFQSLFLVHKHIEIDTIIDQSADSKLVLQFLSENIGLILIILKSIELGNLLVKHLYLVFDIANSECDWNKDTGSAIERVFSNKENKRLKKVTIMDLRDDIIEKHIVSGLSQTSSLSRVVIKDKLLSAERNSLIKKIINADFTNSSLCEILIDNISLHNGIKKDPDWEIQIDTRLGISKPKAIPNWKVNSDDKSIIIRTFCLLNQTFLNIERCSHSDSSIIIGKSVLQNLRTLDLSHTCLNFVALFEILQNDTRVTHLNLSDCTQAVSVDILQRNKMLKNMLTSNTSLKVLNLTGLMDETFASSLIEVLPLCSLKSLSLDLNIKAYAFDKVEALVSSYVNSKLIQLTFTDICHLGKELDTQCIPQCISLECSSTLPFSVSLLNSWSTLFMLVSINKQFSRLNLTLGTTGCLTLKVYQMFFTSVSQSCQVDSLSAPMNLLQSLKVLQLGITHDTNDLAIAIIESLQHCHTSCLEDLKLSHDKSIFIFTSKCQALASCYEQFLSSSDTLISVNFGHINDVIAEGVAAGLKSRKSKLFTLQFNASSLTTKSIASLFHIIINGNLTCMQISDGIFIKKIEEGSSYSVDVFGDNIFLCKIFIALTQVSPYHCSTLMTSFASGHKLDLRVQDIHSVQPPSIKSSLASNVIKHIMLKGGSYVTELVLSSNTELTKDDEDLVGCAFEQLLLSDVSNLCSLKLDACGIPDAVCIKIAEGLADNTSLKSLDLSRNLLTSYGIGKLLASLGMNNTLMELNLSDNKLSDSQVITDEIGNEIEYMVKENSTLAMLHLMSDNNNCLYSSIACKIATGLGNNTALRVLSLQIKEEGVLVKLFRSLQQNQVLNELNIEESSVTNALVGLSIQKMLKCNKALEILKMGYSGITDEVCELIAGGLGNNKQLKTLNLCNNRICSSGIISLFQVLDDNKCCLKELNISLNCDRPWRASDDIQLDRILATNSSLEILIISDGGYFGESFGLELFKGLKCNSKLHTLDISRNYFDATTSKVFTEMIKHNTTLVQLDIRYCQFTFWNLNFTNASLKKVTISSDLRSLFDTETSEMEIDVIQPY